MQTSFFRASNAASPYFLMALHTSLLYNKIAKRREVTGCISHGEQALSYLRKKDKRLCEVIDRIGHIDRTVAPDLFSSVLHHIIGQQISTKAQATI